MIALLKIPLLKPILAVTITAAVAFITIAPTAEVAMIGVGGNVIVLVLGILLKNKLTEIHVMLNSSLTKLLEEKGKASFAEGRREGREAAEAKQDVKDAGIAEGRKEKL